MDVTIFLFAAIILVLLLLVTWHQRRLGIWQKIGLTVGIIMGAISLLAIVLGFSLGLPLLIRIVIGVVSCVILTAVTLSHYNLLNSSSQGEVRRPIQIEGLGKASLNSITLTSFGRNPETFVGNVWTIKIRNRLSNSLSNCNAEVRIFVDGRDRGDGLPLRWRGIGELPNTSNCGGTLENREQYRNILAFFYVGDLYNTGVEFVTIPKDGRNDVLYLFTFSESVSSFIISIPQQGLTEIDMPSITIPLTDLNRYSFLIRFYSTQTDTEEIMFRLKATTWDEIDLVQT